VVSPAALLAAIPDTPEMRALDRAFVGERAPAERPAAAGHRPGRIGRQMRCPVERDREEAGVARLAVELALSVAYAGAARAAASAGRTRHFDTLPHRGGGSAHAKCGRPGCDGACRPDISQ